MGRLKIFAMTAIAAATIGVGGLYAAPSASAMPNCDALFFRGDMYYNLGNVAAATGNVYQASWYWGMAQAYFDMAKECWGG
jgi:hypothetical protein